MPSWSERLVIDRLSTSRELPSLSDESVNTRSSACGLGKPDCGLVSMEQAWPVSPAIRSKKNGRYQCYVELKQQMFEASWTTDTPVFDPTAATLVICQLSDAMSAVWSSSRLLAYGTDACVRLLDASDCPVAKLAHPNDEARQRIRHEYHIMRALSELDGVARVAPKPLIDQYGVLYGFCLEYLVNLELDDVTARSGDVCRAVEMLHAAGYCHGDLSPSNVMMNRKGEMVLIDFGLSGAMGALVPPFIPDWVYCSDVFHKDGDIARTQRFFGSTTARTTTGIMACDPSTSPRTT